jgi:hypothetical protein
MATVSIDPEENADDPQIRKAEEALIELNADLTARIAAIPKARKIAMADGKTLSRDDIRKLWDKVRFVITTKTFGRGYGGSFDYASGTSYIRADTVNGWNVFPSGAEFITLHELIHSCKHGEAVRQAMWKKYYKENKSKPNYADKYRDTPEFSEVEEYCYAGARAIMRELGIPDFQGQFDHGYEYGDLTR